MSKLAEENIWWPSCTMNSTEVTLGDDMKHNIPTNLTPEIIHTYTMTQTKYQIIWECMCGRALSRYKYPREEHNRGTAGGGSSLSRR